MYAATTLSCPPSCADVRVVVDELGGCCSLGLRGVVTDDFERLAHARGVVDVWIVASDGDLATLPRSTRWTIGGPGRPLDAFPAVQSASSW